MVITVQVDLEVARALDQRNATADLAQPARDLQRLVRDAGARLEPLHPGAADAQLVTFFAVHAQNPAEAEDLMQKLRQHPAILAAYIKPAEELP